METKENKPQLQKEITDTVINRIDELQKNGQLKLPKNYAVGNELKLAYFKLQETVDKDKRPALEVCTRESIANALLKMCLQGLSVWKRQGDFIVYGNKLTFQPEYHGDIALALRTGKVTGIPVASVIYEGDIFKYEIRDGKIIIIEHRQTLDNIDINKIKGAYAIVPTIDGNYVELMTIQQIRQSWMQGYMEGKSGAHKNFTDQMVKKTVIGRALKLFISSSDDGYLFGDDEDFDEPKPTETKQLEEVDFDESEVIETVKPEPVSIKKDTIAENQTSEAPKKQPATVITEQKTQKPVEPKIDF